MVAFNFGEDRDGGRDLDRLWIEAVLGLALPRAGAVSNVMQFHTRVASSGILESYRHRMAAGMALFRAAVTYPHWAWSAQKKDYGT